MKEDLFVETSRTLQPTFVCSTVINLNRQVFCLSHQEDERPHDSAEGFERKEKKKAEKQRHKKKNKRKTILVKMN